ncbi:MAG: hypothetical protein IJ424_03630 [Oscillospiraceae bacterium]|nr:hypothetical protein [Oscillospiraceae bacterium]
MSDYSTKKKPRRVRYHFSLVFFVAVFIFGFMFYKYVTETTLEDVLAKEGSISLPAASDSVENTDNANETPPTEDNDPEESEAAEPGINPVPLGEKKSSDYLDSCIFIGDSITYGLASYNVVPSANVYASVSMSISKVETAEIETQYGKMTILEALTNKQPENIYIMLGSNGAAFMNVNDMYQSFSSFMKKVSELCPQSEIYILSVPPVTANKESSTETPILNSDLDEFNEKLLEYADRNNMHYVDVCTALKDENGKLPEDDAENDGLHLKYSAYTKLIDYVLSHVAE